MDHAFPLLDYVSRHRLPIITIGAGETIFLKGDAADRMFVVRAGHVEILMYGRVLERIGPGGIFGEMALIDADTRSAAALTRETCEAYAIDKSAFLTLVRQEPRFALAVLSIIAERMKRAASLAATVAKPKRP
ncbi:MAG: cyclic nucleotide-binding domain-containing protein [Hyphomicrobiaceae bacterium]